MAKGRTTAGPKAAKSLVEEAERLIRAAAPPGEALALLEDAPAAAHEDALYWYYLGYARLQAGDPVAGATALERSIELHEHPNTWHYLGYARIDLGQFPEARDALKHCLALGGPSQAHYELAYAFLCEGLAEDAARTVRSYLLKHPDDFDAWELYEAACRQLGKPRTYRRFLSRRADQPLKRLLRGRDRFSMGAAPFPVPFEGRAESTTDVKLEFLTAVGSAYLGSSADDGLASPSFPPRELNVADIAVMLVRLQGVLASGRIRVNAIVPADEQSVPVVEVLSELLGSGVLAPGTGASALSGEGVVLFLQTIGHDWVGFQRRVDSFGGPALTVVLALDWFQAGLPFEACFTPDIVGLIALRVLPGPVAADRPAALQKKLRDAVRQTRHEESEAQRQYYRRQPGLRFR